MVFRRSIYKTPAQLRAMIAPGLITADALQAVRAMIAPGVTTGELDAEAERVIRAAGAEPNFMLVKGYHHTVCASVNEQVVHGIPGDRVLEPGDIVSIDAGAQFAGWNGDSALTVVIPDASRPEVVAERERLSEVTHGSLWAGIARLPTASHLGEVGAAIQEHIESQGTYGILRDYVGHGIGRKMHEDPQIPNYGAPGRGPRLKPGMTLAIEPMINMGTYEVKTLRDNWTVITRDKKWSAHFEHTIAVTDGEPEILTRL